MLKSFTKDIMTYMPSKLLPALTGFITLPILTRLFLPEEYARYALAKGVSDFFFAFAASGVASVPIRFLPAYRSESDRSVFMTTLGVTVAAVVSVVALIGAVALYLLRGILPQDLVLLLAISLGVFAGQTIYLVLMHIVQAEMRSGIYTLFELLDRYGNLVIGLVLVIIFGFGVEGLLWGEFIAFALLVPTLTIVALRGTKPRPKHWKPQDAGRMWQYAWPLAVGNTAMWGLRLSDRYVIGFFRSDTEVGLYSMAYHLSARSIDLLVTLFMLTMAPMVINAWEREGRATTEETITMITRLFLLLCLPAAVGLTVLAEPVMSLLTTRAYADGARIVGFIAFSSFAWGLAQIAGRGMLIGKKTGQIAANQGIAAAINITLNLLLVPRYGFVMAGISNLVGYTLLIGLQAYTSRAYITWHFPTQTFWRVLIAAVLMGSGVIVFYNLGTFGGRESPSFLWLFLSIGVGMAIYLVALLLLQEFRKEERAWAKRFVHRVAVQMGVAEP
jgi:O-antigen/teichoic acid export membrane protein